MIRILAYTAPLTMPFVVLVLIRLLYLLAGVDQPTTDTVVFVSSVVGCIAGCVIGISYSMATWGDK